MKTLKLSVIYIGMMVIVKVFDTFFSSINIITFYFLVQQNQYFYANFSFNKVNLTDKSDFY
jgi:hypothetical protein